MNENSEGVAKHYYKIGAAGVAVCYAIYSAATKSAGDALFSVIIAILLFLSEANLAPRKLAFIARNAFYKSDCLARRLLVILAIAGSALVLDMIYGLDFLPSWLDLWVKRIAPAFIIICLVLYFSSVISKRIFLLSEINKDNLIKSYETPFYILTIIFMLAVLIFFLGFPVEQYIPTSRKYVDIGLSWSKNAIKAYGVVISICMVWIVGLAACIFSRYFEWFWMISLKKNNP